MNTPKQKLFCEQYALCLNGTKAAILAGYAEKSARQQGARLLSKANIQAEIARILEKGTKKAEIRLGDVIAELRGVMFADMELIGIPHRFVFSERGLDAGTLEYKGRTDTENSDIQLDAAIEFIKAKI